MKSCIVYLIRNDQRTKNEFYTSLQYLHSSFNYTYQYDVLAFVESGFSEEFKQKVTKNFPLVQFRQIEFPPNNIPIQAAGVVIASGFTDRFHEKNN